MIDLVHDKMAKQMFRGQNIMKLRVLETNKLPKITKQERENSKDR